MLSEHTGIGHERVHLTATGDKDGFKSRLRFRAEFIKLKLELSNYSINKIITGHLRIEHHDRDEEKKQAQRQISKASWLWHVHSCSESQNMENPGWKSSTSTV